VVLTKAGPSVYIERLRPDDMTGAFLAQLPDVPPARGTSICAPPVEPAQHSIMTRARSSIRDDRHRLEALMKQPRTGGAKLYGARRDHRGIRQRSTNWITVVDTQSGRWVTYLTEDGAINAVPGTRQILASQLTKL
jgi:hypothetical protein